MFTFIFKQLAFNFAVSRLKNKALLVYLRTLQFARRSLLFAFILFSFFQLMILGFVGSIVTGVWMIPIDDTQVKLWIILGIFAAMFLIPILFLLIFFSEKHWYQISGAQEFVRTNELASTSS